MDQLLIVFIIFLAVFTQSLAGFGSALVAMAFLPELLGIRVATPLVAMVAMTLEGILLVRYRAVLNLRAVWQVSVASLVGIPLGMLTLKRIDEGSAMTILGVLIFTYALYNLFELRLPEMNHPAWAYTFGLLAGMLGGAYNTSGPPVVIYGNSRRWLPVEFKSNLQGFFFFNSIVVVFGHALSQNITPLVWQDYLMAIPALALGILAGVSLDRMINPVVFRRLVLGLLLVMGGRLFLQGF